MNPGPTIVSFSCYRLHNQYSRENYPAEFLDIASVVCAKRIKCVHDEECVGIWFRFSGILRICSRADKYDEELMAVLGNQHEARRFPLARFTTYEYQTISDLLSVEVSHICG